MKNDIKFTVTEDGTTGLYNNLIKDIYHSRTGALKEAFEKFIYPAEIEQLLKCKNKINVLDICCGTCYNTKAFLSLVNGENVRVDCLDISKEIVFLSPFLNDGIMDIEMKIYILFEMYRNKFEIGDILNNLKQYNTDENNPYFNSAIVSFLKDFLINPHINEPINNYLSFLHNIYYNYISIDNRFSKNTNKYANSKIQFFIGDARDTLRLLNSVYDVVFLDAFSPQIDPTLWTIDFLSLLKQKLNYNSVILSYSKSTPFRSALKELGFVTGKTFIENKDMGTIASLNKDKIKFPLNEYDIKLLDTKSGIPYRDNDLNSTPEKILSGRKLEMELSHRMSHTKFLKFYKKQ